MSRQCTCYILPVTRNVLYYTCYTTRAILNVLLFQKHFIEGIIARANIFMSLNTEDGFKNSKRDFCRALMVDPQNTVARTNLG